MQCSRAPTPSSSHQQLLGCPLPQPFFRSPAQFVAFIWVFLSPPFYFSLIPLFVACQDPRLISVSDPFSLLPRPAALAALPVSRVSLPFHFSLPYPVIPSIPPFPLYPLGCFPFPIFPLPFQSPFLFELAPVCFHQTLIDGVVV